MNTKIFKAISITVILSIAVSLLLTSGAYAQNSVTFSDSSSGSRLTGAGNSASVGEACSGDDPYVEKRKSVEIWGPGSDHQCDGGYISAEAGDPLDTANNPYMFVEVDCEEVDVRARVRGVGGYAYADAGIMAWAELLDIDEGVAHTAIWAEAHADSGPGTGKATADAKAEGRAHAELDASGFFYDEAMLTADSEGIAKAHAGSSNRGTGVTHAWTESGIHAGAELGSLNEYASLYSGSIHVEGVGPRSVARADSSATGNASASGLLGDFGVLVDRSEVDVEGVANTYVRVRGEADAGAFAEAGSVNFVESLEDLWLYPPYPVVIYDAELIDASSIESGSYADVDGHRSSAKADGFVSASTNADGMTSKPDVRLHSDTCVSGRAGSHVSVVKEGNAESYAGAIALNVVDGYVDVWPIGVDVELDMLDVTGLGSYSSAEGLSSRTRVFTNDWVRAYTHADSSWYPSVPDVPTSAASTTNGSASQSIKGKGLGSATSAAGAGSIAATNVVDSCTGNLIAEDFAAVGEGTDVMATDGSRMYPVASLADVETSAWTSPSVSAELTGGSGNSWLKPWKNAGDSTVSGEIYLDPVGTVETDVDKNLAVNPNYAYGYLAGNKPFGWPSRWLLTLVPPSNG